MRYGGIISGVFWLSAGIFLTLRSTHYEIGRLVQPGPGFFPLGLGLLLTLLSLVILAGEIQKASLKPQFAAPTPRKAWKKVVLTLAILLLAALYFEEVGYLLTFFFLVLFLMSVAGGQSWKRILLVAFLSALGIYVVFVLLIEEPLPRGLLGI